MSAQQSTTKPRKRSSALDTRLQGCWLVLTRGVWLAWGILTLTIFFASLPVYVGMLQTPCAGMACENEALLTPEQAGMLNGLGLSPGVYVTYTLAITLATMVVFFMVSAVIAWRRSEDRMALLVALLLVSFGTSKATSVVQTSPSPWQVPNACLFLLGQALLVLVFLLFPSGRFVPRWTRWTLVIYLAALVPFTFFPHAPFLEHSPALWLYYLTSLGEFTILAVVQVYRYRRVSSPMQRQQTKWVASGLTVLCLFTVVGYGLLSFPALQSSSSLYPLALHVVGDFVLLLIPFSFGFAMLRSRLWDIDIIINRTLVYALLTVIVVGVYILMVGILSTLLQASGNVMSLLATGLIAVLFQPLRARLQRGINRLMYGERDEPYTVLSRLLSRLEATLAPQTVLPVLVETVAQALKLPYTAITLRQGDAFSVAASYGLAQDQPLILPLVYHSETIGQLLLTPRATGDSFTAADRRLLEDIARQAGVAVHAVCLTADLQRSREHLVTTREEERRRLRRDLHDGLGPTLASMTLKLDAARLLLAQKPSEVAPLLLELKVQMQATIADIRRLVYDLRPPALDELGLVSALREQATQFSQLNGMSVSLEMPERLPHLSAAVEVAVYRIVLEALTNVARHAQARSCCIRIAQASTLSVEVSDDGIGLPSHPHAGVGIPSMRERAAELGGTCVIEAGAPTGTRILVHLPLAKE